MKKMILLLLALALAVSGLTVLAENETESHDEGKGEFSLVDMISGYVLEITDETILIQSMNGMFVEALLTADTTFEGKEPAIGDVVRITYSGVMTRSLPAQITAQNVAVHMLQGIVGFLSETGFTLTFGEEFWQVNAEPAMLEGLLDGMFVTVYHNGMMTRSIPAQVSAEHIRGHEIIGTVTEMVEGGFILTVEGEEIPYHVAIMDDALTFVQPEPGMEIIVVTNGVVTSSLESMLVNASELLPLPTAQELSDISGVVSEITDEFILITTPDGQELQVNLFPETFFEGKEVEAGDFIHVTCNGQMTFSIPAQIAALKVGCYTHTGVVSEITEGQFTLTTEAEMFIVHATEELLATLTDGASVTVYTNGVVGLSLPPQITAEMITATETIVD